jgi:hypothetical protein
MITRRDSLVGGAALGIASASGALAADHPMPAPESWDDPLFAEPFVDADEWRDAPVRHRYVHGGFRGTDALFALYFPEKARYEGRFFQHLMYVSGDEHFYARAPGERNDLGFALSSGAYFVESNLGKKDMFPDADPTISEMVGWRTSAAVAKHSRKLAAEMYGPHRPWGYVFGGSGGAFKTLGCFESTTGIWDGAVPYIMGSLMSIPSSFTIQAHAFRVLKDKLPRIVDAADAGGGDLYAGLDPEEAAALREATLMGFPPRTWYAHQEIASHFTGVFATLLERMYEWDPGYFEDFWKVPGYLGADPPESLKRARVQHQTMVRRVIMSDEARRMGLPLPMSAAQLAVVPAAFELASLPKGADLQGAGLRLSSGAAAGKELYVVDVLGEVVTVAFGPSVFKVVNQIRAGDVLSLDNSNWLAMQTHHRHQVPAAEFYPWNQYRGADGEPLYPQRPVLVGPIYAKMGGATSLQTGRFSGKMIVVESLMDEAAYPWNADWYRTRVQAALGARFEENYRLWYVDRALHGAPATKLDGSHVIDNYGVVQQALRDLAAWVEKGIAPPPSTRYEIVETQVVVPADAQARGGVQPVLKLAADGAARAEAKVGQPVALAASVEIPAGGGRLVAAEWDLEGAGEFAPAPALSEADRAGDRIALRTTHAFARPGTYFPTLRITCHRQGDAGSSFARIRNLERVRVVVS